MTALETDGAQPATSIWPIIFAPVVACVYYLAIKFAFAESIVAVMGRTDFFDLPRWGSSWTFRLAAEAIAVSVGTFVAASLARDRERIAGIVGGCTISLGFVAKLILAYAGLDEIASVEPWYQYAIDALMVVAAPALGAFVIDSAKDLNRSHPQGVGGINRLHFLWLWPVAYFYALGLIAPVGRIYALSEPNFISVAMTLLINGIPAASILIPAYYGLAFLAGYHGDTMHPAGRNMVGALVLVFGFLVGAVIQSGWYWIIRVTYQAIFG